MAHYKTRQMEELVSYMQSVKGNHVTVNDISDHFKSVGIEVGITTIYRHLEKMVKEGTVVKYVIESSSSACFEYVGEGQNESSQCYHCKCEVCGKLIHMHCHEVAGLSQHMLDHHGFAVDMTRTVFYGICDECRKAV